MKYAIGIDIGGTTVASGIVDQTGTILAEAIVPSDSSGREAMFASVVASVELLLKDSPISLQSINGMGVGVPGKVDREQGIAVFQNNLPWEQFPIAARIKEQFGVDHVVIDNDVYMATFAEWHDLQMAPDELLVYMTVSTGISCALIQNGAFLRGGGFAGEVGLIPVEAPREVQAVERLEEVASGPALERYARNAFNDPSVTAKDVFARFQDGDHVAEQLIADMVTSLTHGIYQISSLLDPHHIVFGGSVATHNPELLVLIKEKLATYVIDEQRHVLDQLSVSTLGNGQGIIGAGLMGFAH